jgi:putative thioredoxin
MSATHSEWVFDVGEADFDRAVIEASRERPVVADFWAPWCPPCVALGPVLERLVAERRGEVVLARVNVDEAPGLAGRFGIGSIPAVKAFRDGRVFREFTGLLPESHLRAFLDEVVPGEADRLRDQARRLESTDPAGSERLYREVLDRQPGDDDVRVGLARVLLARDEPGEVARVLEPVGAEGPLGAEAQRLGATAYFRRLARQFGAEAAARRRLEEQPDSARVRYELGVALAAAGKLEEALPVLLEAAEKDVGLAAQEVREAMVQAFYALGVHHPLADEYRGKLARLLY